MFGRERLLFENCGEMTLTHTATGTKADALECKENSGSFFMSPDSLKFIYSMVSFDYLVGITENAGTPSMQIGTCSRF